MKCPHCGAPNGDEARFCGVCGRATAATEPSSAGKHPAVALLDLTGREIGGRYRILTKLGEGGMGAVYRGEQISLKRKVAIKLLKPELSADPGLVRRFNAEAELVAKLSHPNVVNIYDFGQDKDGTLFIAMEYIEGRSLRAAMNSEGPLSSRRAVAIASQVASSLTDAHAHGIVHRDLKPDNVMLTERGKEKDVVRVLDFGIAKLRDEGKNTVQQMTQAGDLVGTPQYMAPEQIRGDRVDGRTDVYALGAMLYEMITGRLPFEGATVMAILSKHLTETPPSPAVRRPDLAIAPALDALVMASLAKQPDQRIASMELVGEQLAAIGAQLGASGSQPFVIPVGPSAAGWSPGMPTQQTAASPSSSGGIGAQASTPAQAPHGQPQPYPYPPAPQPHPMYAPHATGTPPPMTHGAPRKSRAPLWIALGVLAAGGIAAGAIVAATRGDKAGSAVASGSGSQVASASDDPWAGGSGTGTGTGTGGEQAVLDGAQYSDKAGWSVFLPTGFATTPVIKQMNGSIVSGFDGHVDGVEAGVAIVAINGVKPDMSDAEAMRAAQDFAKSINGTLFSFDFPTIHGARRLRAIYDVPTGRIEAVLYTGSPLSIVAMFGTDRAHFDDTESLRRELFERRVSPP